MIATEGFKNTLVKGIKGGGNGMLSWDQTTADKLMLFNSVIRKGTVMASLSGGGEDGEGEPALDVLRH